MRVWCSDSPGFGGAELSLLRVLSLTDSGTSRNNIVLHSVKAAPQFTQKLDEMGIERRGMFSGGNRISSAKIQLVQARAIFQSFPNASFIVWCHHLDSNRWLQLALAACGARFIVAERLIPTDHKILRNSRLTRPLKAFVARRADAIVLNAERLKVPYSRMFSVEEARLKVICNSRPIDEICAQIRQLRLAKPALKQKLGLHPEAEIVLCVARLTNDKRQIDLLAAAERCLVTFPNLQVVLVGEGEARQELEKFAERLGGGRVVFAGERNDVISFLAVADVFVLPSEVEGLPGALIEAMAAKVPCIASDIPGNCELVTHNETGLTFSVKAVDQLAARLRTLLELPVCARNFAERGYLHVKSLYDYEAESKSWLELLHNL